MLDILYQDEQMIAINKPHGLLVHRSPIARDANVFALQLLRDQIGKYVYPVHRLDRKTGGVLLFALDKNSSASLQRQFQEDKVRKTYHAIVRGYTADSGEIDYPLLQENGKLQEAYTVYRTRGWAELALPFGKHQTSRYSLLQICPSTGRMHQIRKHMAHILHPVIGDRPHGCNKQNRLFKERWQMDTLLLHAAQLEISHPLSGERIHIAATKQSEFRRMMRLMGFEDNFN